MSLDMRGSHAEAAPKLYLCFLVAVFETGRQGIVKTEVVKLETTWEKSCGAFLNLQTGHDQLSSPLAPASYR